MYTYGICKFEENGLCVIVKQVY